MMLALSIIVLSCSDSGPVSWGECPDYLMNAGQECATVKMPLTSTGSDGRQIDVFVWRVLSQIDRSDVKGQLWLLQGGPGNSSVGFTAVLPQIMKHHPEWDIYSLDHRGTGNSAGLHCPGAVGPGETINAGNAEDCVTELQKKWGASGLSAFSTTNAARDVGRLIDLMKPAGGKVFVYGVSYGTYWAMRYLQLHPKQASGVVLDSICVPGECAVDDYDANFNHSGHQVFDLCAADATCRQKLSVIDPDPWTATGIVFGKVASNAICEPLKAMVTPATLRQGLAKLNQTVYGRALVPAVILRVNRCSAPDVVALTSLFAKKSGTASGRYFEGFVAEDMLNSTALGMNVIIPELYKGISPASAKAIQDAAYVSEDVTLDVAETGSAGLWPAYDDQYIGDIPATNIPVLMVNSNIDGQTPLSSAIKAKAIFDQDFQTFIEIPDAAHGAVFQSPLKDYPTTKSEMCGVKIMFGFMANPRGDMDTSCLSSMYSLEFSGVSSENVAASNAYFGTANMWE
jgi:pimeloyl-ACP methyl ester carboxylesterase